MFTDVSYVKVGCNHLLISLHASCIKTLQVPGFAPKPPTHGVNANGEGPAAWRAGLRKMGSSSAVPECATNKYKDIDKLLRSASSSWLSNTDKKQDVSVSLTSLEGVGKRKGH